MDKKVPVSKGVSVTVTDLEENKTFTFDSISKAAKEIGTSVKSLTRYINTSGSEGVKLPYLDRYSVISDRFSTTVELNCLATEGPEFHNSNKLSISRVVWKKELSDHYRKHNLIVKFLKEDNKPNKEFLNELLSYPEPSLVKDTHLELCAKIYNMRVVMPLPFPRTKYVATFRELVGGESYESKIKLAGCYIICGTRKVLSTTTNLEGMECYIGQSMHLGHRIKSHTKGADPTTGKFIESIKDNGKLELCIVSDDLIPQDLTKSQFITLLEQYLILKLKPTVNKKLLAKPGIMWTPEAIQKHREKISKSVYAYLKEKDEMILVQVFPTTRSVGLSIGKGKSFFSNIITRTDGWHKDLFFTNAELEGAEQRLMTLIEFTLMVEKGSGERTGTCLRVTDVTTGEVTDYISMRAVTRVVGIDTKGIREKLDSSKLYKNRFKFEMVV